MCMLYGLTVLIMASRSIASDLIPIAIRLCNYVNKLTSHTKPNLATARLSDTSCH